MRHDVQQVEPGCVEAEELVAKHVHDVHHRPVIVQWRVVHEGPYAREEKPGEVRRVLYPFVPKDLEVVVIDKTVGKGVKVYHNSSYSYY